MSMNLPSRQFSRSASTHVQRPHLVLSSTELYPSISLFALSQPSRCQYPRHFQTCTPSRKVKSLRPDAYTPVVNETALKSSSPITTKSIPRTATRPSLKDETTSSDPAQLRRDIQERAQAAAARARARVQEEQRKVPQMGSLADNSLFADPQQAQGSQTGVSTASGKDDIRVFDPAALELRNPSRLAAALNPRPKARSMWHRRMVIRSVRQRGRLTKIVKLARSERSSLSKSHFFSTSMKKLAPLARQIAGKPIDEAILQMRFSKKKVAKEVREHLIQAKAEAIVVRGMGLGHLEQETQMVNPQDSTSLLLSTTASTLPLTTTSLEPSTTTSLELSTPTPPNPSTTPTTKTSPPPRHLPGTTILANPSLRPPTSIYISQAWINRGPYHQKLDYRAFGRLNIMRPPHTAISVLLKEERTRTREAADRETKKIRRRMGKNMWTQLPDRKISRQGQYLLW